MRNCLRFVAGFVVFAMLMMTGAFQQKACAAFVAEIDRDVDKRYPACRV